MRVRQLSPTGDYTFGNSALNFLVNSPEAVGQVVKTTLLLWLGEWYLDTTLGVPYLQGILGVHSQATADATIQAQVLAIDNVVDISSYSSSIDPVSRFYSVNMTIDTAFGPTAVQIANYANY